MSSDLRALFRRVRAATCALAAPLRVEDQVVQTMPDVSPTKWHLAHTSWFFETFLLRPDVGGYQPYDERYATLFNSYYYGAGDRHPRPQRGHLSRPTVADVLAYRRHVDEAMERFFDEAHLVEKRAFLIELGVNHEEQHQELILTDIKHVLGENPLEPPYQEVADGAPARARPLGWREHPGGLAEVGYDGSGFAFDNERPRHRVHLARHALADRLVTSGEYLQFIDDGGYRRPELWLSDGWDTCSREGWIGPLYWHEDHHLFTMHGARRIDPDEPVCHVSYYEADAYARWAGARLPSEAELEAAGDGEGFAGGNFLESGRLHPRGGDGLHGDVWQWTSSAYLAYPGFVPFDGTVGEYNGKFMSNRMVLRGGSCFTPRRHLRTTYRNFFPPDARWQMTGFRLARDLGG